MPVQGMIPFSLYEKKTFPAELPVLQQQGLEVAVTPEATLALRNPMHFPVVLFPKEQSEVQDSQNSRVVWAEGP